MCLSRLFLVLRCGEIRVAELKASGKHGAFVPHQRLGCCSKCSRGMLQFLLCNKSGAISTVLNIERPSPAIKVRIYFTSGTDCSFQEKGLDCWRHGDRHIICLNAFCSEVRWQPQLKVMASRCCPQGILLHVGSALSPPGSSHCLLGSGLRSWWVTAEHPEHQIQQSVGPEWLPLLVCLMRAAGRPHQGSQAACDARAHVCARAANLCFQ